MIVIKGEGIIESVTSLLGLLPELLSPRDPKALKKAIEQGHVVTAVFVKSYKKEKGNGRQCDYKYEVNGKTYTCSIFSDNPPRTLELYYVRNPKNANIATAINVSEKNWFLRFAIVAAIIILFAKVIL